MGWVELGWVELGWVGLGLGGLHGNDNVMGLGMVGLEYGYVKRERVSEICM